MKRPTRKVLGMTWLGWVNVLVFQWFCVRLVLEIDGTDDSTIVGFGVTVGCLPFTGYKWSRLDCWPWAKDLMFYRAHRDRPWVHERELLKAERPATPPAQPQP